MYSNNKREELRKKILSYGGSVVHVVGEDSTIEMWTNRGEFMSGEESIVHDSAPMMMCHENSLKFYLNNNNIKICTGFAINFDSSSKAWVRHSWCIDENGIIHECTPVKRDMYFGTILNERETEQFREDWDYEYAASKRSTKKTQDKISIDDIAQRTEKANASDKSVVDGIFSKLKKQMIEMGILKNDR